MPILGTGDRTRCALDVARDREVDVGHAITAKRVPDRAADDPRIVAVAERGTRGADAGRGGEG